MIYIYCKATEDIDVFRDTLQYFDVETGEVSVTIENRRSFRCLEELKKVVASDDILMIHSLSSLGLNDNDIAGQLSWMIACSVRLVISSISSTYEYGTEQPMNRAVISTLLHSLQSNNKKILTVNKRTNSGRNKMSFPDDWDELYDSWEKKEITSKQFLEKSGLKKATFYNMITEYRSMLDKTHAFKKRYVKIG